MPFPFAYVCDLLEKLEEPFLREVGYLPGRLYEYIRNHTSKWFMMHRTKLDAHSTNVNAVLSILWPQRQTDRTYGLDQAHLEMMIARALQLSKLHFLELQSWRTDPLKRDLAFFVQRVMKNAKKTANSVQSNKVMVEDIDNVLLQIASFHAESSREVQSLADTPGWNDADYVTLLGDLYQQLQPREAKWLTRLVLKNLGPLKLPDDMDLSASSGHSSLPQCLQVSIKIAPMTTSTAIRREASKIIRGEVPDKAMLVPKNSTAQACAPTIRQLPPTSPESLPAVSVLRSLGKTPRSNLFTAARGALPYTLQALPIILPAPQITEKPINKPAAPTSLEVEIVPGSPPTPSAKTRRPSRPILGELSSNANNSQRSSCSQVSSPPKSTHIINGTGSCQLTSNNCPLKYCIFILSPCIASPWNSNLISLLSWHGCHYTTSISALNHPSAPRRCPQTSKRYRKIVLVESNRTKETAQFLKQIVNRRMGEAGKKGRDCLCVYDWRLLESIGKADQGKTLSHDPWVRLFIGKV